MLNETGTRYQQDPSYPNLLVRNIGLGYVFGVSAWLGAYGAMRAVHWIINRNK